MPPSTVADVVIIGAGPVGLFAVFECGMLKLHCHVVDTFDAIGGQCSALYPEKPIYDIPGFPRIGAGKLVENLALQAAPFKPTYHLGQTVRALRSLAGRPDRGRAVGRRHAGRAGGDHRRRRRHARAEPAAARRHRTLRGPSRHLPRRQRRGAARPAHRRCRRRRLGGRLDARPARRRLARDAGPSARQVPRRAGIGAGADGRCRARQGRAA